YTNNAKGRATKNVKWWITLRDWVVRDEVKGCALYVKSSTPMPLVAKGQDEAPVPVLLSE
ncbi:hypothetical protein, partial [Pseudomonas syringae]|uniref:hypothetical protein n=1 Tax=Pseudomonas syringae TaxID=317 RepID=UPI0034D5486C